MGLRDAAWYCAVWCCVVLCCVVLNKYLWYEYGVLTREPALLVITIGGLCLIIMAQRNGPAHAELRTTRRPVTTPHLISCISSYLTSPYLTHHIPPHLTSPCFVSSSLFSSFFLLIFLLFLQKMKTYYDGRSAYLRK